LRVMIKQMSVALWIRQGCIPMPLVQVAGTSGSAGCRRSANAW
jgi:hypothetical protein